MEGINSKKTVALMKNVEKERRIKQKCEGASGRDWSTMTQRNAPRSDKQSACTETSAVR
jgi:hypothetical protein